MSFLADKASAVPQDPNGRPFALTRLVKIFESNNMTTLEADVNTFLTVLQAMSAPVVIFGIAYLGTQGSASRIMVSYGIFAAI